MADTEILWRGLTIGGDTDIDVHEISGWDDLDDLDTSLDQPRVRAHGDHPGPIYSRARTVTVRGAIANRQARDQLVQAVLGATPVSSEEEPLTIETFGRRLTAGARLVRRSLPVGEDYASGHVPFALAWRCTDPLRYGPEKSLSTALPASGGGLAWPLFANGVLDWGTAGTSGQLVLVNEGTADAGIVLEVAAGTTHGLPSGFEISAAGRRITYGTAVPPGQHIEIDTETGAVLAEGTADRRLELLNSDWLLVPGRDQQTGAPGSLTVQFTSLGGTRDPAALLTARWEDTYW
ncbi:phage tail domain-containing protein [Blastococcus sp. TF02A-26]|uniref:phage tail domain-containing protein n=1 Tax=Blastococcus sp. TF02A-26 TaxID=2250577 RepID=UPI000DE83A58|nr:phage tail domain-containing protein [Blastococcus sp. TF02A-26]RBY82685.1 hypothetical protein DQ240_18500 [Blastococcus sp. TF02A-26]